MTDKEVQVDPDAGVESLVHDISQIRDLDMVLSRLLVHARSQTRAEAGSIFLFAGGQLQFRTMQNDALERRDVHTEQHRLRAGSIQSSNTSLCGYAASTGQTLRIDDAYNIPRDEPYHFDSSFDEKWAYHTQSVMAVPVRMPDDTVLGILQLINAQNDDAIPVPFSGADLVVAELFAKQAAMSIERAQMTRALIMRMIAMAELRDPSETGPHVNRVAEYSVEIYRTWARTHNVPDDEVRTYRDTLRLAAMLHDVGKVATPDGILKKPGKLTEDEFAVMKTHTVHGARLFMDEFSEIDRMSRDIALCHHERWDGSGYPGKLADLNANPITLGPGKQGDEIPLSARLVSLADVYDALTSRRSYKEPWTEERVLETIRDARGKQFDPELVDAFFASYELIRPA
jgi:hypothetical protein